MKKSPNKTFFRFTVAASLAGAEYVAIERYGSI
jgi:hypothetical protein